MSLRRHDAARREHPARARLADERSRGHRGVADDRQCRTPGLFGHEVIQDGGQRKVEVVEVVPVSTVQPGRPPRRSAASVVLSTAPPHGPSTREANATRTPP